MRGEASHRTKRGPRELEDYLNSLGLEYDLLEFRESVKSVKDAVKAAGVPASSIVKSLVVVCGDRVYCVVIPGDKKLDLKRLSESLGCSSARLASREEVLKATGYDVGGVPPVGHGLPVVLDNRLLEKDYVVGGGGDDRHLVRIKVSDIVRAAKPFVAELT